MATTAASANSKSLYRALQKRKTRDHNERLTPNGVYFINREDIPVLAADLNGIGDETYLIKFPSPCYLLSGSVTVTDMDTGGAPALVFDINIDDGTTEQTVVNDSAIGQAGGSASFSNTKLPGLDVGGQYLALKVGTAAATAAAGTVDVSLLVSTTKVSNF